MFTVCAPVARPIVIAPVPLVPPRSNVPDVCAPNTVTLPVVVVLYTVLLVPAALIKSPPTTVISPCTVMLPALSTRTFSVAAAPFCISRNTKSKSSLVAVTSVVTASICIPISLLFALVSAIN